MRKLLAKLIRLNYILEGYPKNYNPKKSLLSFSLSIISSKMYRVWEWIVLKIHLIMFFKRSSVIKQKIMTRHAKFYAEMSSMLNLEKILETAIWDWK